MHLSKWAQVTAVIIFVSCSLAVGATKSGPAESLRLGERSALIQLVPAGEDAPELVADQVVMKLKLEAIRPETELPEYSLPRGVPQLQEKLDRHGIVDGFRVRRTNGKPIRNLDLFKQVGLDRLYVLRLPQAEAAKTLSLIRELNEESWVEYAGPVFRHVPTAAPNDPFFGVQWPHHNIGQADAFGTFDADMDTLEAWDVNTGDSSGTVAILDTGVQMIGSTVTHPDLLGNVDIANSWDFIQGDPNPQDTQGHGTSAAGIAAAEGNNGVGVAGTCQGCRILVYRVATSVDDADAIMLAADNGADTINMSHTFGCVFFQEILDATAYAAGLGALPVASAANSDGYGCAAPAAYPTVISAGGTDQGDNRIYTYADYSEISAPGVLALSTGLSSQYVYFGGTSASSPYIAGVGALLRSERGDLNINQLRHIMRVGADDQVGNPPDPEGWDIEMGFGRANANESMNLLNAKWIALDRGHYHCEQDLTIAVQDADAGAKLDVTLAGDVSGDEETVTLTKVAGTDDYYEGTIALNWTDKSGAEGSGDGLLDVTHGEGIVATDGPRTAAAFTDCTKAVCRAPLRLDFGDCDLDGSADPGEDRVFDVLPLNLQTELMEDVTVHLTTESPWLEVLLPQAQYGDLLPQSLVGLSPESSPRVRVRAGAPAGASATVNLEISGKGWTGDTAECKAAGWANDPVTLYLNRDKGTPTGIAADFDSGSDGFTLAAAHGTGDLPECTDAYGSTWNVAPSSGRVHQGSAAWGTVNPYFNLTDEGLVSAPFTVPEGGGVLGWYHWIDAEWFDIGFPINFTWDGMILEAKRTGETTWTYLTDVAYNHELYQNNCDASFPFGAPGDPQLRMFSGDGDGTALAADSYDREMEANLSQFAGDEIQVRWRFGSDLFSSMEGAWIDTVKVYNGYTADSWPGGAPENLQSSDANCNASLDLSADAITGAASYTWYRSEVSCLEAQLSGAPFANTAAPFLSDPTVASDVEYFYALQAIEASANSCPTERVCISGGCSCTTPPVDPTITAVDKTATDVLFKLDYSGVSADLYRDPTENPASWGAPYDAQFEDQAPGESGFQYNDAGGVGDGTIQYYIFTGSRCGIVEPPR